MLAVSLHCTNKGNGGNSNQAALASASVFLKFTNNHCNSL